MNEGKNLKEASVKAGLDEKTARKYIKMGKSPNEIVIEHNWRTREDPFEDVWEEIENLLSENTGLEAKTIFEYFQRVYPGKYMDGQLRTLQRRIKIWRGINGPSKEVYFEQEYIAGELCQSDFTRMKKIGITIQGQEFEHMVYHFVLPYSNWETGSICFSESFESLSEGLQNALFELGGVPKEHQTDRLSAAVHNTKKTEEFTERYEGLLKYYGIKGKKIQAGKANENGDVEQRHYRFKKALEQSLMLRGSKEFTSREEYESYLKRLFKQLNTGRRERFKEELKTLRCLPEKRMDMHNKIKGIRVSQGSTIRVKHNTYSVHSRLIGELITVLLYSTYLEIWYAQKCVEIIPRLRGENKHYIQYRHIIDWLIRKPGAFANYRYRHDLFPTHRFRMAYDAVKENHGIEGDKKYLKILYLAAYESEDAVDKVLEYLIKNEESITVEKVETLVKSTQQLPCAKDISIKNVDIKAYDELLSCSGGGM
ncbi:MAG: IS21 family transposase [Nitrospinae bacterium]|nr:IS21 family transposase [Nitrospinota bacterium]